MKTVVVIPAHLASVRFPRKILFPICGLPMIEHVRRRALMAESVVDVIVATCDAEIASVIETFGGNVVMTARTHENGTMRVAEAIKSIDCSHVILLQGDEPLVLPRHIDGLNEGIKAASERDAWNATGPIESPAELYRPSVVKCMTSTSGRIICCFRRTPIDKSFEKQILMIKKILGLIAYQKSFLLKLPSLDAGTIESIESIEQMRVIEHDFYLQSVPLIPSLPSVNEPNDISIVLKCLTEIDEQKKLLKAVLG